MIRVRQKRFIRIDNSLERLISSNFITKLRGIIIVYNNNNKKIIKRMAIKIMEIIIKTTINKQ